MQKSKPYKPENTYNYNLTPRYGSLVGNAGLPIPSQNFLVFILGELT